MQHSLILTIFMGKQQNRNPATARIGCSICRKIAISGRSTQIEGALSTLRFVGLEDVARQTALQILLLPPA